LFPYKFPRAQQQLRRWSKRFAGKVPSRHFVCLTAPLMIKRYRFKAMDWRMPL
jgi:hypothetical protein